MESCFKLCRLCLASDPSGVNLFKPRKSKYFLLLSGHFQIELQDVPGWPLTACSSCVEKLEDINQFKATINSSQEKLSQLLSSIRIKCEPVEYVEPTEETIDRPEDRDELDEPFGMSIKQELASDAEDDEDDSSSDEISSLGELSSSEDNFTTDSDDDNPPRKRTRTGKGTPHVPVNPKYEKMLRDLNVLRCQPCNQKFTSLSGATKHEITFHRKSKSNASRVTCCSVQFWGRAETYDHMQYHLNENAFKCKDCGKKWLCGRQLKRHINTIHKAPKTLDFKCKTCGKAFKSKNNLYMHSKKHIDPKERQIKCPQCDKKYNFASELKAHFKSAHTKSKAAKCDICGKIVVFLEEHIKRKHSPKDKLTPCSACGKEMSQIQLREHMRRAHGDRSFPCPTCGIKFKTKSHLKVHKDREHLGITFNCFFCPHRSRSLSNLNTHHNYTHPVEHAERKRQEKEAKLKN